MSELTPSMMDVRGRGASGLLLLGISLLAAVWFFYEGVDALLAAWATPEYSHGPAIPILSAILLLRQLKTEPIVVGPVNRLPGMGVFVVAIAFAAIGKLAGISEVVAYATILWVGAVLLVSFGWAQGRRFWPAVLHLVYMLPLPGVFYYKLSTYLQSVSSEWGVAILQALSVPVFLDGNIIELDSIKLHVAEACSGLRYLFPILSFSYVFAVLYRGPTWHKAVLLIAAAPVTVVMNAVRIAIAGLVVQHSGAEHLEGFTHFFEGWVIFIACIVLLLALAQLLVWSRRDGVQMWSAFDLDFDALVPQLARLKLIEPSKALKLMIAILLVGAAAWSLRPQAAPMHIERTPFALFPRQLETWSAQSTARFSSEVEGTLGADDYTRLIYKTGETSSPVEFFAAYYNDQTQGGTHSPEICLPSSGWEIASLDRIDLNTLFPIGHAYNVNRAIIQKGEARMMAFYWFEQHGRHVAWDFEAKLMLLWDGVMLGRTDGALVRLTTPIEPSESDAQAQARLIAFFDQMRRQLPQYVPVAPSLEH